MNKIAPYDNGEIVGEGTGWVVQNDCPLLMESTRMHTEEEYEEQLGKLKMIENASPFWLGYIANKGKEEIGRGEMISIAKRSGYEEKYLWNTAYVYRQFETSLISEVYKQYPNIPWGVYQVCAPLPEEDKRKFLILAGEKKLTAPQMRQEIIGGEWQPNCFNIWSAFPIEEWQNKYPGQIPGGILKNVIYYTTNKGDLVIDPFGGGGNMALTCNRMERNCITYDIDPKFPGIIKHNVMFPFPDGNAQLVFLDPPYGAQKKGEYASDPADLSNIDDMRLFHSALKIVCDNAKAALKDGGYLVLIIGTSQTKDRYIDHAAEMYSLLKDEWIHINSVAAAYPTTQYSGNDVKNAKDNCYMLNLYTTIQFWQKP